jgi:voltage-gated potassium channel
MSPTSLEDLDRGQQRRLVARSAIRIAASTAVLVALYALLPAAGRSGARAISELVFGLVVFAVILVYQVRSILGAEHPELRAAEALALAVALPALVIVFAFSYLALSRASHANFSEPLDHVGATYFTVTVISTVGFGDTTAKTDLARVLVTIQILLDLVLVAWSCGRSCSPPGSACAADRANAHRPRARIALESQTEDEQASDAPSAGCSCRGAPSVTRRHVPKTATGTVTRATGARHRPSRRRDGR